MDFFSFVVIALAVWRISSLFSVEDGPADIFAKFRNFVGVRYDELSKPYGTNNIAKAFICVGCFSVWVGVAAFIIWLIIPKFVFYASIPFALSAAAVIVEKYVGE